MKNWLLCISLTLLFACSEGTQRNNNPFLPNYGFSITINKNLPQYSGLNSPINPIVIRESTAGISGIIAMKISDNDYRAWELSCPNQAPTTCSVMTLNGLSAKCGCDDNFEYSLFTGIGNAPYPMKSYRIEVLGDLIRISN
jgi:hypothetical protein